jgi:hypothetical protein
LSIVSLLHYPDDARGQAAFVFDHAQEHKKLVAQMGSPSPYNLINYLLDPMPPDALSTPASLWDMNHQQAHDDAANYFNVQPSLTLIDTPTQRQAPFQWFLFTNSREHNALNQAAILLGHASA